MLLAQKEMFFQLRQQTGNSSSLQEYKCPSHHCTEECADLAEGTQNYVFMLVRQKTSASHNSSKAGSEKIPTEINQLKVL